MIRSVRPVPPRRASGLLADVYGQIRRDFGPVAEPFLVLSPLPEVLAGAWCVLREAVLVGEVPRRDKEVVAAAVSRANECPFCVEIHSTFVAAAGDAATARRLRGGGGAAGDGRTAAIAAWAEATGRPGSSLLAAPPFAAGEAPELLATAVGFHFVNRLVTVFLGASALPPLVRPLRGPVLAVVAWRMRPWVAGRRSPGDSLALLPEAPPPPEVGWAVDRPHLAGAFGRWESALRGAAERRLPEATRRRVEERTAEWRGEPAPLGTAWLEEAVAGLDEGAAAAARVALLTALAPHRLGDGEIAALRRALPGDEPLLAAAGWGAATAARRVAGWIAPPATAA